MLALELSLRRGKPAGGAEQERSWIGPASGSVIAAELPLLPRKAAGGVKRGTQGYREREERNARRPGREEKCAGGMGAGNMARR